VSLRLDTNDLQVGESTTARATVTQNGVPAVGKSVTFNTGNATIASVSPAVAVTDAGGQAQSVVKGQAKGETTVSAAANGATANAPVRVPDLSVAAIALIVVLAGIIVLKRNLKAPSKT
jgi:hypothetical protein